MTARCSFCAARLLAVFVFIAAGILLPHVADAEEPPRPNVLLIAVDDLNHWVKHLGRNPQVITPHIDRLAKRGVTFTRSYCVAPACNPSRAALMSGLRPSSTGVYSNPDDWRKAIPPEKTLNVHFRKNGYHVAGVGKIYHGGTNNPNDWDEYHKPGKSARGSAPRGEKGQPIRPAADSLALFTVIRSPHVWRRPGSP